MKRYSQNLKHIILNFQYYVDITDAVKVMREEMNVKGGLVEAFGERYHMTLFSLCSLPKSLGKLMQS